MRHLNRRKNEKYSRMNVTVELDKEIYTWAVFILNLNVNNWYGLAKYIWFGIIISLLLFLKRFFVLFYIYFILYMSILPAHMYVILCSCFQWRPEEVVVNQEKNFLWATMWVLGILPVGPLKKQPVLFTTEPTPQPLNYNSLFDNSNTFLWSKTKKINFNIIIKYFHWKFLNPLLSACLIINISNFLWKQA